MSKLALDISAHQGRPTATWFEQVAKSYKLGISQAWGGVPGGKRGANPDCEYQLRGFRSAGMDTAIYIWVPPDDAVETDALVRASLSAAGDELRHCLFVAPDLEGSKLHPRDPGARLLNLIDNILALTRKQLRRPLPVVIYCRANNWRIVMGGTHAEFGKYPLWEARYALPSGSAPQEPPDVDWLWRRFGGWNQRAILQYAGTADTFGMGADRNVVDYERLRLKKPAPKPKREPGPSPNRKVDGLLREVASIKSEIKKLGKRLEAVDKKLKGRVRRPRETPKPTVKYHVVKSGETASGIAAECGLTWAKFVKLNPGDPESGNWNLIRAGERFRIR